MTSAAVVHLDESCLGNGREGQNPGGGGGLIEARGANGRIQRRDFYISAPATTNNRMALAGAIAGLQLVSERGIRVGMLYVDAANEPAVALYRSLGFTVHRIDRAYARQIEPR